MSEANSGPGRVTREQRGHLFLIGLDCSRSKALILCHKPWRLNLTVTECLFSFTNRMFGR